MAPKRKSDSSECNSAKKARKALTLEMKMEVIKKYEGGMKVNCISRSLHLSHSTVSTILKDKERIKDAVKGAAPFKSTIITKQREGTIADMEKLLFTWLEDNRQRNVQVMLRAVQSKATSLFKMLKEKGGEEYASLEFIASDGWFRRFRDRYQVHHVLTKGEAASSDAPAAKAFVEEFDKLIVKEGYLPEQIFNVDETALFWKKMPKGTYISKEFASAPGALRKNFL
ncbi:tigger transposable element-derived protein 1-like [Macrobrachium nipponense]|uniref:tigger transposable element-derived protein 1-like n=1 Tax=Macrobrachium nipponense TaxID=159736 RepID=UPI0030C7BA90